ncbi:MAG: hypothetical protein WKG00_25835 [Polyangiaceae bacterium]
MSASSSQLGSWPPVSRCGSSIKSAARGSEIGSRSFLVSKRSALPASTPESPWSAW